MPKPSIEIEGADEIRRQLRDIGDAGLKKQLADANKAGAEIVVKRALPNVPVLTGRLKASIRALGSQREGKAKAGNAGKADHAGAIHWGRIRGNVGYSPNNRMGLNPVRGRPFLYDAARAAADDVTREYERSVDRLLDAIRSR